MRCRIPQISSVDLADTEIFKDGTINIEMDELDTEEHLEKMGISGLNSNNFMGDISMPPQYYDQPFIMYCVNSDMVPNFYNGTRGLGENGLASSKITLNVQDIKDIKDNKIKIRAVTCKGGWKDSKAAEITFKVIDQEKPQDGNYVFRPNEFGVP